jgi:hypothetical protein
MDLASKLQLAPTQHLQCVSIPQTVASELERHTRRESVADEDALLVFAISSAELSALKEEVLNSAGRDRLTWIAYPKSGQLGSDMNRDSLAALLISWGLRPVRQIAIDDVWSALRFRPELAIHTA